MAKDGGIIKGSYSPFIEFVCKPHLTTWLPQWGRETGKSKKSVYVVGCLVDPTKWELNSAGCGETGSRVQSFLHAQVKRPPSCFFHPWNAGAGSLAAQSCLTLEGPWVTLCGFLQGRESRRSENSRPQRPIPCLSPLSRARQKHSLEQDKGGVRLLYLQGPLGTKFAIIFPLRSQTRERG